MYSQLEKINFEQTFVPIARLKVIRWLLAYSYYKWFKLYQIDIKGVLLDEVINENIYVEHPPWLKSHDKLDYVYKFKKTLCWVKQEHRVWYDICF